MTLEAKPEGMDPSKRRFIKQGAALAAGLVVPSVEAAPNFDNIAMAYEKLLLFQLDEDDIKEINEGKIPSIVFQFSEHRKVKKTIGIAATIGGVVGAAHFLTVPEGEEKARTDNNPTGLSAKQLNILGIASGGLAVAGLASLSGIEGRKKFENEAQQSLQDWIGSLIAKKEKVTMETVRERIEELTQRQLRNNGKVGRKP